MSHKPIKTQRSPTSTMSSSASSRNSPDVVMSASGELAYPHHWIGSTNPIHEKTHVITPTSSSTQQQFLQYYGFQTTPVAIYNMTFEDGPRVKGQPKMFHANFTHPHDGSNFLIDGKVYTHKAFSNQQAAYQKDRYGMCIVSPTLCYTLHGIVDNEKKRVERIARELRIDGEDKCAKKKRRQVFKINDSAVMMRRPGFEADYPTYAFNTNATYTIAFYSRHTSDHVIHTGVRYTQCEHDVFVHITSSHGGEIAIESTPAVMVSRKRKATPAVKKRRRSEVSEVSETYHEPEPVPSSHAMIEPIQSSHHEPIQPSQPHSPLHHTPLSPISTPSSPDTPNEIMEFPIISYVSESSFVSEKRARVEHMSYDAFPSLPSYGQASYGQGVSHPLITGPSHPSHPTLLSLPSYTHPLSSPLFDFPLIDPLDSLNDIIPDTMPSLSSGFSLELGNGMGEETWLL